jgi:hypothetical protein
MIKTNRNLQIALCLMAAFTSGYVVKILYSYAFTRGYVDHIEPNVVIAAWRYQAGYAIYQSYDEWPVFANAYGPLVYLFHAAVFWLAGASIALSKLANSIAVILTIALFFGYCLKRYQLTSACIGTLFLMGFILYNSPITIWSRPDPFTMFLSVAAVAGKEILPSRMGKWAPHVIVGICIGLAVNLKVHSFVYFIPLIIYLCGWTNFAQMALIIATSFAVFSLPFMLPNVSFVNYVQTLFGLSHGRFSSLVGFFSVLKSVLFYYVPLIFLGLLAYLNKEHLEDRDKAYLISLIACVAISIYPASVPGAGAYHLLPLAPLMIDFFLRFGETCKTMPRVKLGIMLLLPAIILTLSVPVQRRLHRNMERVGNVAVHQELKDIAAKHQGSTLQMGYGNSFKNYWLTYQKPVLAFAGNPITIDAQVFMENQVGKIDFTDKITAEFRSCRTRHWLIPKGEQPFGLQSYYGGVDVFHQARTVFMEIHEKTESRTFYDVWSCKGGVK